MDVKAMTPTQTLRHALVMREEELIEAASNGEVAITRQLSTAVRGAIALADAALGWVSATAWLDGVDPPGPGDAAAPAIEVYSWRITQVELLAQPFRLQAGVVGPLWARLKHEDRLALSGVIEGLAHPPSASDAFTSETLERHEALEADGAGSVSAPRGSDPASKVVASTATDPPVDTVSHDSGSAHVPTPDDSAAVDAAEDTTALITTELEHESLAVSEPEDDPVSAYPETVGGEITDPPVSAQIKRPPEEAFDETTPEEAARARAFAFVPSRQVTEEEARKILVRLRETEIKSTFPEVPAHAGLLRKSLLDHLIEEAVEKEADFYRLVSREMLNATDRLQIETYLEPVISILTKIK